MRSLGLVELGDAHADVVTAEVLDLWGRHDGRDVTTGTRLGEDDDDDTYSTILILNSKHKLNSNSDS